MPLKNKALVTAIFIALFSVAVSSQTKSDEHHLCDQDFARSLAAQLASEGRSVSEPYKKIKILIRLADFVWELDEPNARTYFTEAFKAAADNFREKGFETRSLSDDPRSAFTQIPDYRFEVIKAIAKHDPAWARRLSDEVMEEFEKTAKDRKRFDREREIHALMSVAQDFVLTNPELSLALFRRIMRYPLDYHWYFALYGVAGKNDAFAAALYMELLQNYRNATPRRMLFLSAYPFVRNRIMGIGRVQYGVTVPEGLVPRQDLQQAFIETFLFRVIAFAENPEERLMPAEEHHSPEPTYIVSALAEIEPIVIERFPFLLQRLGEAKARANSLLTEDMRKTMGEREKWTESVESGFEARLRQAEEADEQGKLTDYMIFGLVEASKQEEHFRAAEPWLDKIKEDRVKTAVTNYFWFLRAKLAIKEERFADAERFAKKVPELEHRSILAFDLTEQQLKSVYDRPSAYQTLNEVAKLVRTGDNTVSKAKILLGLAYQYEKFNHGFALEELGEAVRVINRMKDPDLFSTAESRQIIGKSFAFYTVYSMPGYDLENTFREISKNDFELGLSNARAIDDKFLKTIGMLAVAKNCRENVKSEADDETEN